MLMRWFLALLVAALSCGNAFAQQRRAVAESEAIAYIHSAFITQADPGVVSQGVVLGPELERRLGLGQGTNNEKVYAALIGLTGDKSVQVRRATPDEIDAYGTRRGFEPARRPLFTLRAGDLSLIVHYDLQAASILFVGQLGVLDPDPRPVPAPRIEPKQVAAAQPQPELKKDTTVNLAWTGLFEYNSARLTPEAREKLDSEIVPKLMSIADLRYLQVYGHTDRLGKADYNRQLSEKRAEAVRDYLVAKGVSPEKIEIFGYGQTLPIRSCADEKKRSALIDCLAPNRRVVMEIQGRQP